MGGKVKVKGKSGKVSQHLSRNQSLRKLQISLSNFRRLCIYKGIFPRELNGKIRYYKKDITYLSHDPLIQYFRQERIYNKKLKIAQNKNDQINIKYLMNHQPALDLEHVIKDRYPTFDDALKDLDDALSLLFSLSNLPRVRQIPVFFYIKL